MTTKLEKRLLAMAIAISDIEDEMDDLKKDAKKAVSELGKAIIAEIEKVCGRTERTLDAMKKPKAKGKRK